VIATGVVGVNDFFRNGYQKFTAFPAGCHCQPQQQASLSDENKSFSDSLLSCHGP
jgi:hypothetical protein